MSEKNTQHGIVTGECRIFTRDCRQCGNCTKPSPKVDCQVITKPENGKGKYTFPDGTIYEGDWVNGKPHGYGKEESNDEGTRFIHEGYWVDGKWHGKGREIFDLYGEFYEIYEGNWVNGRRHARGKAHSKVAMSTKATGLMANCEREIYIHN